MSLRHCATDVRYFSSQLTITNQTRLVPNITLHHCSILFPICSVLLCCAIAAAGRQPITAACGVLLYTAFQDTRLNSDISLVLHLLTFALPLSYASNTSAFFWPDAADNQLTIMCSAPMHIQIACDSSCYQPQLSSNYLL